jgi:hypothetical protein
MAQEGTPLVGGAVVGAPRRVTKGALVVLGAVAVCGVAGVALARSSTPTAAGAPLEAASMMDDYWMDQGSTSAAFNGADVVAFFHNITTGDAPLRGIVKHSYTLRTSDGLNMSNFFETEFWFVSAVNKEIFVSNPRKYAPRYGGFCSYGITSELDANKTKGMDVAGATEGWPWARDYLGPPGNPEAWTIYDGKLYFAFFAGPLDAFLADAASNVDRGDARWASWFGQEQDEDVAPKGPMNTDCLASSYGPPVERTCCLEPQKLHGIASPESPLTDDCLSALNSVCGTRQGDNPVSPSGAKCSDCLLSNHTQLSTAGCPATDTALHAKVDKIYCW